MATKKTEEFVKVKDVLAVDKLGIISIDGQPLTPQEVSFLKSEVDMLRTMRIWSIFQETVKQKAIEKAVYTSLNFEQTLAGKMMLHNLGILKSITDAISNYEVPKPPELPIKKKTLPVENE